MAGRGTAAAARAKVARACVAGDEAAPSMWARVQPRAAFRFQRPSGVQQRIVARGICLGTAPRLLLAHADPACV